MAKMITVRVVDFNRLGIADPSFGASAIRDARRERRQARRGKRRAKRVERIEDDTRDARKERKAAEKRRASRGQKKRQGAGPERVPVTPRDLQRDEGRGPGRGMRPGQRPGQGPGQGPGSKAQRGWESPWSKLGPQGDEEEQGWDDDEQLDEELLDEELLDEELLDDEQGWDDDEQSDEDEFQGLPAWGAKLPLGKHLRIQPARGHRAAVMEYRPGLYLVAEVPEKVARAEEKRAKYGLIPLLPGLLVNAATTAVQRLRANTPPNQASPPAAPATSSAPQGLQSVPVVSGMRPPMPEVYASLGWADYGCNDCGRGRRSTRRR